MLGWARKYSLFCYPFVTACCGMEFMALSGPRFDHSRFGAEIPRFSPRQADLLWVVGTISQRQAPALRRIYEQMTEPKWVLAFGTCASSSAPSIRCGTRLITAPGRTRTGSCTPRAFLYSQRRPSSRPAFIEGCSAPRSPQGSPR
ncbi:hypothetical protein QHF83_36085 [Polyangium sp. 15x6]|nr:hypothetical protein [Polyangium sp. 15x6]MDI3288785.1 hypothetical protein [Polyangium sp. 15x6]